MTRDPDPNGAGGDAGRPEKRGREGEKGDTGAEADACEACPCRPAGEGDRDARPGLPAGDERASIYADARARMERRDYAKVLATIGGLTAAASLAAPLAGLTRVFEREYTGPVYSDGVALVNDAGERVPETALAVGEWTTVFPEPRPGLEKSPTLLVRLPEGAYGGETRLEYTVAGYAAYSKVCTHAGCMVSEREDEVFVCPCHFGKFDPAGGARVVGGPPPRPLPQLPITLSSDGYLVATGDFEGPVGPGGGG